VNGAHKLEGVYLPEALLARYDVRHPPVPTVNEDRFHLARPGPEAVIQRYVLHEHELIVAGPSLRSAIGPVRPRDLRWAVRALLRDWWMPMIADPTRLRSRLATLCCPNHMSHALHPGTRRHSNQNRCGAMGDGGAGWGVGCPDLACVALEAR
jgi:hypothetical protein